MVVDEAARTQFQTLLAQHWGIVLKVAYSYGRSAEDRDDLAQEIALQLWRSFPRYDASRKFSTWMYRVALNVAISDWRRHGKQAPALVSIDGDEAIQLIAPPTPEPDERIAALNRLIAELDPLNRALLLLYLEERPYREIAEILGISETNVATKLNRLKQRIRQGIVVYTAAATTEKQFVEKGEN
jgi:RNA polymerase sigma-70 factor (ECF subfamily)